MADLPTLTDALGVVDAWLRDTNDDSELASAVVQVVDAAERAKAELPPWADSGYTWVRLPVTGPEDTLKHLRATLDLEDDDTRRRMVKWLHDEYPPYAPLAPVG